MFQDVYLVEYEGDENNDNETSEPSMRPPSEAVTTTTAASSSKTWPYSNTSNIWIKYLPPAFISLPAMRQLKASQCTSGFQALTVF